MAADTMKAPFNPADPDSDRIWTQGARFYALLEYHYNSDAVVLNAAIWLSIFDRTLQGETKFVFLHDHRGMAIETLFFFNLIE